MALRKKVGFHIYLPGHIISFLFERGPSSLEIKQENGEIYLCHSLSKPLLVVWKEKVQSGKATDEYILFILSWRSNGRKWFHEGNLMASELRRQCFGFHTNSSTSHSIGRASVLSANGRCVGSGNITSSYFVLACGHRSSIDSDGILKSSLWLSLWFAEFQEVNRVQVFLLGT